MLLCVHGDIPLANTKRNRVRATADEEVAERPRRRTSRGASASGSSGGRWARFKVFLSDERTHKVLGLLLLLTSAFLVVAFVSFLFTWRIDQDLVGRPWSEIFKPELRVENWLGKVGALVSHRFIHKWFGMAAFLIPLWCFIGAIRILLGTWILPPRRTMAWSAMIAVWLPALLGFFFRGELMFLGGGIGHTITHHLTGLLGTFGTGALIIFAAAAFTVFTFNLSFNWANEALEKLRAKREAADEDEDESLAAEAAIVPVGGVKLRPSKAIASEELADLEEEEEIEEEDELEVEPVEKEAAVAPVAGPTFELDNEPTVAAPVVPPVVAAAPTPALASDSEENGFSVQVAKSEETILNETEIDERLKEFGEYDPTLDLSSYKPPPIDLLIDHGTGEVTVTKEELEQNKDRIVETLGHYNIGIEKIKATIGPTVTLYEIIPKAGVRISKIKNLEDDIALSLAALGIRIIAPIPGKGTIGIEVPNSKPQIVGMRSVISSEKFQNSGMDLPIVLGKTISNETYVTDLAKMPHLLMAGATGQGKSVGLNAILVSLLYKKHPSQIKFVLVDPKKVELTLFNKIERHFLAKLPGSEEAIITDTKKVVATLNSLCIEMDERYELLKDAQVRNIKEYNAKFIKRRLNPENGHRFLPYIVLVVDEFADLIMTAGREVETPIARLAQLARAIGIHLIIATQRPSVNIITGTIKANFPARIAFRVTSKIDSRTILDSGGAEQLIGRGDMLLSTGNELIRIQCAFVDTPEVDEITAFIGNQRGYPEALILPEVPTEDGDSVELDSGDRDSLFEDAARLVVMTQQGSTSLIQRKLKLGYNRAGRIVDQLEAAGILGGFEGSKARRVMIPNEAALDAMLNPSNISNGN